MRKEKDSLGEIEVEKDKLWGAGTQRNLTNFTVGKEKIPLQIIYAYSMVKKAAAIANFKLDLLSKEKKDLIVSAVDDILDKKYDDHFPLLIWQTGSGTPTHMNVNEVISNIACLKSNKPLGSKEPLHPNDDVNMAQSTNDTFPSAIHIATYFLVKDELMPALKNLKKGFIGKQLKIKKATAKSGSFINGEVVGTGRAGTPLIQFATAAGRKAPSTKRTKSGGFGRSYSRMIERSSTK